MTKGANPANTARDERLAARLRENLKRRKQQARAIHAQEGDQAQHGGEAQGDGALPKSPLKD